MAGPGVFRVDLEALASSASHVTGLGDDLAGAHLSFDNRIVAAELGWVCRGRLPGFGRHRQLGRATFLTPPAFGA